MKFDFSESAKKEFYQLDKKTQKKVKEVIRKFLRRERVDIKKMQGEENQWRLAVDKYRVVFEREKDNLLIVRIKLRKDVFR